MSSVTRALRVFLYVSESKCFKLLDHFFPDEKVRSALLELRGLALKSCAEPSVVNKVSKLRKGNLANTYHLTSFYAILHLTVVLRSPLVKTLSRLRAILPCQTKEKFKYEYES